MSGYLPKQILCVKLPLISLNSQRITGTGKQQLLSIFPFTAAGSQTGMARFETFWKHEFYLILINLYWLLLNNPCDWFGKWRSSQRARVGPIIRARRYQTGGIKDIKLNNSVLNRRKNLVLKTVFWEKKKDRRFKHLNNYIKYGMSDMCMCKIQYCEY